jgi:hypothetical protein
MSGGSSFGANVIKLFTAVSYEFCAKLECLLELAREIHQGQTL